MLTTLLVYTLSLFHLYHIAVLCEVDVPMCNKDAYIPRLDSLTPLDLTRIQKLEQLHIVSRHGSRTGQYGIKYVFPNMNTSVPNTTWECNFTSITSRNYDGEKFMSLQKNYVPGEELIGGNCLDSQSTFQIVNQHKKNGKLIHQYYIGDEPRNLFTTHELNNIMDDIFKHRKYEDNNTPFIKIISGDLERTYSTASIFMTEFLRYSDGLAKKRNRKWIYNGNIDYLYSYTHDPASDPYFPQKTKGCKKLKQYIGDRGKSSELFQEWVNSDYVQSFWKQWEDEVGYPYDDSDDMFKVGENIMWMYCGNINLIPGVMSEDLFNKVQNYTLEYRSKLLRNGPISEETTSLASMPFVWILKTLIEDHIYFLNGNTDQLSGYLDAEQAKLVFHSTRGISTLYFLSALGIGDGIEPIYANMVNFEIYSRSYSDYDDGNDKQHNVLDKYIFRITKEGKFLPFPGCDDDYLNGTSTLCNINVFMKQLRALAMPFKEWEHHCDKVTKSYYAAQKAKKKDTDMAVDDGVIIPSVNGGDGMNSNGIGIWCFVIGALFGALIMWIFDRVNYFKNVFRNDYIVVD